MAQHQGRGIPDGKYKTRAVTFACELKTVTRLSNPRFLRNVAGAILRARDFRFLGGAYGYGAGQESWIPGTSQIRQRCGRAAASQRASGGLVSLILEIWFR